jgi:hypothetical protein
MVIIMKIMKNRGGWIEIVEAFVAVLLIAGVVLVILNRGYLPKTDVSDSVYETELSILREIQTNSSFRIEIVNIPENQLPAVWEASPPFPLDVKNKIIERTPNYLTCVGRICNMSKTCSLGENNGKDIYSQPVVISATLQNITYRQLNLFCWMK